MSRRIVVIGAMGMLGRELLSHLSGSPDLDVVGTFHKAESNSSTKLLSFDATSDDAAIRKLIEGAYLVVNCAAVLSGALRDASPSAVQNLLAVNAVFPKRLALEAELHGVRIIHISSDAVFSGRMGGTRPTAGPYGETERADPSDLYGISKYLGEINSPNVLNLRTSLIGRDPTYKRGLLEWYLSQEKGALVHGYGNYLWQGVTTRQLAMVVSSIAQQGAFEKFREATGIFHFCPNGSVTKLELLAMLERVFGRGVRVASTDVEGGPIDRRLRTEFESLDLYYRGTRDLESALRELVED